MLRASRPGSGRSRPRRPQIVVDLGGLEFIDASGVAALARGRKHARRASGDLLLAAPGYHGWWPRRRPGMVGSGAWRRQILARVNSRSAVARAWSDGVNV